MIVVNALLERRSPRRPKLPRVLEARLPRAPTFAVATTFRCTVCDRATTRPLGDCVLMLHLRHARCACGASVRMPLLVRETLAGLRLSASAS